MAKFKGNRKLGILFGVLSIAWVALLFTESSQPPAKIMGEVPGLDKVAHFMAFGGLAALVCLTILNIKNKPLPSMLFFPLVVVTFFGGLEELYQGTVPGRLGSLQDLLADICGAITATTLISLVVLQVCGKDRS